MSNNITSPLKVRSRCQEYAGRPYPKDFDDRLFGAVIGHINAAVKQLDPEGKDITNHNRHLILAFLFEREDIQFTPLSSSELSPQQKNGLCNWVGSVQDPVSGKWIPRSTFRAEANWILAVSQFFLAMTDYYRETDSVYLGRLIRMYRTEAGINEDLVSQDYWLSAALSLPGAVFTRMREDVPGVPAESLDLDVEPAKAESENKELLVDTIEEEGYFIL